MDMTSTPITTGQPGYEVPPPPVALIDTQPPAHCRQRYRQHLLFIRRAPLSIPPQLATVWEDHIPRIFRPAIAVRLDRLWLREGSSCDWEEQGERIVLSLGDCFCSPEWRTQVQYAIGHLMAYALLFKPPLCPAGADVGSIPPPMYDQSAPVTLRYSWLLELAQSQPGAERRVKRAMAEEWTLAWGLHRPAATVEAMAGTATPRMR